MVELPLPALIGVVHLAPLPGAPLHLLSLDEIIERAVRDARTLADAGFDALIVENFGDRPFTAAALPPASLAAMAVAADQVRREVGLPLGVNALRNDARAALGIAAAAQASFIRVNVHVGVAATDQGIIEGRADETLRYRKLLGKRIAVFADVDVKHAAPIGRYDLASAARETAYRGLADALIVTGPATGAAVNPEDLLTVRKAVSDRRVFVGSGARAETAAQLLALADGVIVGTGVKEGGTTENPVDAGAARAFVSAARSARRC